MKKYIVSFLSLALVLPLSASAIYLEAGSDAELELNGKAKSEQSAGSETGVSPIRLLNETEVDASVDGSTEVSIESEIEASMASEDKVEVDVKSDGDVEIRSKHNGKFLGFLPITFTAKTVVEKQTDGTLSAHVEMPWWSFLIIGVEKVRANIEAILSANVSANADANSELELGNSIRSSLETAVAAEAGN